MSHKPKTFRGIRRHPQPCYCFSCYQDSTSAYLKKKQALKWVEQLLKDLQLK